MKNNFLILGRKQTNGKFVEVEKRLKEKRISNIDDRRTDSNRSLQIFGSKTPDFWLRLFFDQKRLVPNFDNFHQERPLSNIGHLDQKLRNFEILTRNFDLFSIFADSNFLSNHETKKTLFQFSPKNDKAFVETRILYKIER